MAVLEQNIQHLKIELVHVHEQLLVLDKAGFLKTSSSFSISLLDDKLASEELGTDAALGTVPTATVMSPRVFWMMLAVSFAVNLAFRAVHSPALRVTQVKASISSHPEKLGNAVTMAFLLRARSRTATSSAVCSSASAPVN